MIAVVLLPVIYSCAGPAPTTESKAPVAEKPSLPSGASWQQRWDATVAEAKKEGRVSIYSIWPPEARTTLQKAFRDKFGIDVEFTPFARGADLLARLQQEKRAGINAADLVGAGTTTLLVNIKPEGLLTAIDSFLILPEATDPKVWNGDKFPFLDKDKTATGMVAAINRYVMYNTSLVGKGEITSFKDLLNPKYQGKMTLSDPTVSGVGSGLISHLAYNVWNIEEAKDFLRRLVQGQKVAIERDNRIQVESVVRGKYALAVGSEQEVVVQLLRAGASIDAAMFKEGTVVNPGAGAMAVPTTIANSNAAKVFVNWLLTKEGQIVFSHSLGIPSLRNDVSTEGFHPLFLVQPGEKVFLDDEGMIFFRGKMMQISKEVINE